MSDVIRPVILAGSSTHEDSYRESLQNRKAALERLRVAFEGGDKGALLEAVDLCGAWRMVMPLWLATGFSKAYRQRWNSPPVMKSWNEVFGRPWPAGTKPGKLDGIKNSLWAYVRVREIREAELASGRTPSPIDEALFERLGEEARVSAAVVKRWFYHAKNNNSLIKDFPIPGLLSRTETKEIS